MDSINHELLDFIKASPTPFHTVQSIKKRLIEDGYTELYESDEWHLEEGGGYFISRGETSLIAFRIPNGDFDSYQIAASHTDSPSFKLKPDFELLGKDYITLSADKYGGAVLSSWIDRPLSVAGRLVVRLGGRLVTRLVETEPIALIPSLAPHLGKAELPTMNDMTALVGSSDCKGGLLERLASLAEVSSEDILSHDLYLVNSQSGCIWGADDAFVSSPRLDDLQCVFSSLVGFLLSDDDANAPVFAVFDREEVGSESANGAASSFLPDTLERISLSLGISRAEHMKLLSSSFFISADNAHAAHPNYPNATDPLNCGALNSGIAVKHNAMGRYVTDAESEAVIKALCTLADVPYFDYTNRSDIVGGSTLGHIMQTKLSVSGVDIGLPQLAMHSSYETAGAADTEHAVRLFTEFYNSHIYRVAGKFAVE